MLQRSPSDARRRRTQDRGRLVAPLQIVHELFDLRFFETRALSGLLQVTSPSITWSAVSSVLKSRP